jgi:hypothetical protein
MNSQFNKFLKATNADLFIKSSTGRLIHPDLRFYNILNSAFTFDRSSKFSGSFDFFSNAIFQEYVYPAKDIFYAGEGFG